MSSLIIYGTGSMARVLHSFLRLRGTEVSAFTAPDNYVTKGEFMYGTPVVPWSVMSKREPSTICLAIGYHSMNKMRRQVFGELQEDGWRVSGYWHKRNLMHNNVFVSASSIVYDNVAVHAGSSIGANTFISSNVSIGHDCVVGAHAWINSGVSLAGGVKVGERCVLGINSCVAQGVTLGEGTFVGANTLVTQDTKPGAVVVAEAGKVIDMDSERFIKLVGQP